MIKFRFGNEPHILSLFLPPFVTELLRACEIVLPPPPPVGGLLRHSITTRSLQCLCALMPQSLHFHPCLIRPHNCKHNGKEKDAFVCNGMLLNLNFEFEFGGYSDTVYREYLWYLSAKVKLKGLVHGWTDSRA
jgi:hypothetical protein